MSRYSLTSSHASSNSPSITMEKGRYRLRAPAPIEPFALNLGRATALTQRTSPHSRARQRTSSVAAGLVIILALCSLASFGFAYYLFTTRWGSTALHDKPGLADEHHQVIPFDLQIRTYPESEKFISYLPHSGLHNQRIALENALVLGVLTNRTVLVPPVRLGTKSIRYLNSQALQDVLAISGKEGLRHCAHVRSPFTPPECFDFATFTHVSPAWLFNLTHVHDLVRLEHMADLSPRATLARLNLTSAHVAAFPDSNPYQYRFLDTQSNSSHKYSETLFIPDLAALPHRLLSLGTLFGSSRLRLRLEGNKRIRTTVREAMDLTTPELGHIADRIRDAMGGYYLGIHLRLGDGSFKEEHHNTLHLTWWKLVHEIMQFDHADTLALGRRFGLDPAVSEFRTPSSHVLSRSLPENSFSDAQLQCRRKRHRAASLVKLNWPLFIATDVDGPATNELLAPFRRAFPCALFLSDFTDQLQPLGRIKNAYDGAEMRPFLSSLVDAMVVARAHVVIGTEGSTYSQFIQDVLWPRFHGLPIVERG